VTGKEYQKVKENYKEVETRMDKERVSEDRKRRKGKNYRKKEVEGWKDERCKTERER
jgi:hypothetical protein